MVGVHLHLIQFWLSNIESIENTAIQQNICSYTFAQCWETKLEKQSYKGTYTSVPLVPKVKETSPTKVHQDFSNTHEELMTGTLNSLLYVRGDAERSDYKNNRNIKQTDKHCNYVRS